MNTTKYKSAVINTINNLIKFKEPDKKEAKLDMGNFASSIKHELISLKIPVYNVYISEYRQNVVVIELPFCKSCEIAVEAVEFGQPQKQVTLYIDKKDVRRIKLSQQDTKYMKAITIALVDYFKRFLLLKNKFA